ncbi:FKBP-type peptidyl-prolyl cis-trans isomerase [Pedobacter sp. MW01-1-1]|uniref:FKBP-type peptidyl-prolyl cis-trans isomerase n=1 Tax=Pedobacter sp. MW01-1-1 TaxID=3383027 RepID=UPI003FEE4ACA
MAKLKFIAIFFFSVLMLSACKKDADAEKQITDFISQNNINAVKDASGLYYQIIKPGSGTTKITNSSKITIKYEGRLLNGSVFDNGGGVQQTFTLGQLIQGWQVGIPFIQKGGEIRLIVPPSLGYGAQAVGPIPANSPLDFTVTLIDVQ